MRGASRGRSGRFSGAQAIRFSGAQARRFSGAQASTMPFNKKPKSLIPLAAKCECLKGKEKEGREK